MEKTLRFVLLLFLLNFIPFNSYCQIIYADHTAVISGVFINDVIGPESIGILTFSVILDGAVQGGFTIDYVTSDNTAISGTDYTFTSGTLVFDGIDGEIQTFDVPILDDMIFEPIEDFNATLSNISTNLADIVDGDGVGSIIDNDTAGSGALFTVTKEADLSYVEIAGEVITYTIIIDNVGNEPVSNLIVSDPLVSDLFLLTGDINSNGILDLSEVWIFTATYTVTQFDLDVFGIDENGDPDGDGDIDNCATVIGSDAMGNTIGPFISCEAVEIPFLPVNGYYTITKIGSPATVSYAGEVITYTFTLSNTTNDPISNVVLTDYLVDDLQFISGDLDGNNVCDGGEIWIYQGTYTINQSDLDGNGIDEYGNSDDDGDIDNIVWVNGTNSIGNPIETDFAHEDIEINYNANNGYYEIQKVGSPASVDSVGDMITYTITVANTGWYAVRNLVLTDVLVNDLQYLSGDLDGDNILDAFEAWFYAATYTVTQYDIDNNGIDENGIGDNDGDIDNVVTVNGTNPAGDQTEPDTAHEDIEIETIGVDDVSDLLFNIFPNPVTDILTIQLTEKAAQIDMTISSLQGQIVLNRSFQTQEDRFELDMSNYAAGVYFIKLKTDFGTQTQKIIVK